MQLQVSQLNRRFSNQSEKITTPVGLDGPSAQSIFIPESEERWKGHGRKVKSGLRSTKSAIKQEIAVQPTTKKKAQQTVYSKVFDLHNDLERKMYTDQTGRFPVKSFCGIQYIMVLFEVDSNAIISESMRNRTSGEMISAYKTLVARLKKRGFNPKIHLLDNECSQEYKDTINTNGMEYQLVPHNNHRQNITEK